MSILDGCCRKSISSKFIAVVRQQFVLGITCSVSVPEFVRSQSPFSTDQEVLQSCAGFTSCSSASPAVGRGGGCSTVMGLTPCMLCSRGGGGVFYSDRFDTMYVVCTDLLCVVYWIILCC